MPSSRVDYDAIADGYDDQPHRAKTPDPELASFLADRPEIRQPSLLDIACGTGNQLIANRAIAPAARMVGLDGSLGMLRQARRKAPDLAWLQAEATALPLAAGSVDFISCQYAFHHFRDKRAMLREAFRVLRGAGRLVIYNLCPHAMPDWIYYAYFPEAQSRDLADFWPPETLTAEMWAAGFPDVRQTLEHIRFDRELVEFLGTVRRRENNSQLLTLSDAAYAAGLGLIERDIESPSIPRRRAEHFCILTVSVNKPA